MNFPFLYSEKIFFQRNRTMPLMLFLLFPFVDMALATMALVCTLSVFNGFQDLVATFFTAFDPQLKIPPVSGKVFDGEDARIVKLTEIPERIELITRTLEDNAMVKYQDRQAMVVVKGVEDNFEQQSAIDSILYGRGNPVLHDEVADYVIPGMGLVSVLGSGVRFLDPLVVYAPKRGSKVNLSNPSFSFVSGKLFSSGLVFAVSQEKYDMNYMLTSLDFARRLFQYTTEVSSVEVKLKEGCSVAQAKQKITALLGNEFRVQDRYQQQADTFRIMEVEKLISYFFLTFILMIACFNVIGSLSHVDNRQAERCSDFAQSRCKRPVDYPHLLIRGPYGIIYWSSGRNSSWFVIVLYTAAFLVLFP